MPAGSTYSTIATTTLGSATTSYTFNSVPTTYTDLILVVNLLPEATTRIKLQVGNGSADTASNYSFTILYGNGSSAASARYSSTEIDYYWAALPVGSSAYIINLQNYSNTTTFKTILGRASSAGAEVQANVGLWRSTSAINTVKVFSSVGNFLSGTTLTLYGITAA